MNYHEYIFLYVDDLSMTSKYLNLIMNAVNTTLKFKNDAVDKPKSCLRKVTEEERVFTGILNNIEL